MAFPYTDLSPAPVPLDIAGGWKKGLDLRILSMRPEQIEQEIAASKAAQANTEAQTPGIVADSAIKQKAAAFAKWQQENAPTYATTDPATGKKTVDRQAFVDGAANAGFYTEAQSVAAADLDNRSKNIKNSEDEAKYAKTALGYSASLVMAAPPEQRPALWKQHAAFAAGGADGKGGVPGTDALFGEYDEGKVAALAKATMSPQVQLEQMRLQDKHIIELKGALAAPDSEAGVALLRTIVKGRNPNYDPAKIDKMDGPTLLAFPGVKESITSEIASGTAVTTAKGTALIRTAPERDARMVQADSAAEDQRVLTRAAEASKKPWAELDGEQRKAIQAGYAVINKDRKGKDIIDPSVYVPENSSALFSNAANDAGIREKTLRTQGENRDLTAGKTVKMMNKKGQMADVPEADVDEALKGGLKRVETKPAKSTVTMVYKGSTHEIPIADVEKAKKRGAVLAAKE